MLKKRNFPTFALTALMIGLLTLAATNTFAQTTTEKATGWASRALNAPAAARVSAPESEAGLKRQTGETEFKATASGSDILDVIERAQEARRKALVGTWRINIPQSATGLPPFNAFHTFHQGGTFTEASDLLPTLTESPAFGVWELDGSDKYVLTFELFAFDDKKAPVGIIRVRCSIRLVNADEFTADSIVDFIEPDGNAILDIDRSPFTGKRIKPLAAK